MSKRYHYVINFGTASIFYSSVDSGPLEEYLQSICVLFPRSVSILSIVILKSLRRVLFLFPSFIFHINLQSFKETSFNQLLSGAMPRRGTSAENSVIREGNLEGHKSPFWISVNLSDTFKT